MRPYWQSSCGRFTLYHGDALEVLPTLEAGSVDAIVTDPPYSSGGMYRSDRGRGIAEKYADPKTTRTLELDFTGDCMDARAWSGFTRWWLRHAYAALRPAGYALVFTDWRQLPGLTDVVQMAGFTWRGIVPWDKGPTAKLPHLGYFRHQCEYVVWATRGSLPADHTKGKRALPGVVNAMTPRDREHPTQKPESILQELCRCAPDGGLVVDPFAGAATTGSACLREGRRFLGVEIDERYCEIAARRIEAEAAHLFA